MADEDGGCGERERKVAPLNNEARKSETESPTLFLTPRFPFHPERLSRGVKILLLLADRRIPYRTDHAVQTVSPGRFCRWCKKVVVGGVDIAAGQYLPDKIKSGPHGRVVCATGG